MCGINKSEFYGDSQENWFMFPEWFAAEDTARNIVRTYKSYNVDIKIKEKKGHIVRYADGFKFKVTLGEGTTLQKVTKYVESVKYKLRLPVLESIYEDEELYLSTAKKVSSNANNSLLQIFNAPEYKEAFANKTIAHPIGVTENGKPVIADLDKYPHAMICGTTYSGKTTAIKCIIMSLIQYSPDEINLLLADPVSELSEFSSVPNLSYPIIDDKETFAGAILLLKDEMERRLRLKRTKNADLERCPYIVCIVDEFPSLLGELDDSKKFVVTGAINCMLEQARHARIHFILATRDPKSAVIGISVADLRTKLVFQVTNPQKSLNALGLGKVGAEKLKGEGDMYFYQGGEPLHLHGFNVTDDEIVTAVKESVYTDEPLRENSLSDNDFQTYPRGRYSFTITDEDIQRKNAEFNTIQDVLPSVNNTQAGSGKDDKRLANAILWTLTQDFVSISDVQQNFHMGFSKAKEIMLEMCRMGIVDTQSQGPKGQEVLPKSIDNLSYEVMSLLERYGYNEETIAGAFKQRTGIGSPKSNDGWEDPFEAETEDEQDYESDVAFSGPII